MVHQAQNGQPSPLIGAAKAPDAAPGQAPEFIYSRRMAQWVIEGHVRTVQDLLQFPSIAVDAGRPLSRSASVVSQAVAMAAELMGAGQNKVSPSRYSNRQPAGIMGLTSRAPTDTLAH